MLVSDVRRLGLGGYVLRDLTRGASPCTSYLNAQYRWILVSAVRSTVEYMGYMSTISFQPVATRGKCQEIISLYSLSILSEVCPLIDYYIAHSMHVMGGHTHGCLHSMVVVAVSILGDFTNIYFVSKNTCHNYEITICYIY